MTSRVRQARCGSTSPRPSLARWRTSARKRASICRALASASNDAGVLGEQQRHRRHSTDHPPGGVRTASSTTGHARGGAGRSRGIRGIRRPRRQVAACGVVNGTNWFAACGRAGGLLHRPRRQRAGARLFLLRGTSPVGAQRPSCSRGARGVRASSMKLAIVRPARTRPRTAPSRSSPRAFAEPDGPLRDTLAHGGKEPLRAR